MIQHNCADTSGQALPLVADNPSGSLNELTLSDKFDEVSIGVAHQHRQQQQLQTLQPPALSTAMLSTCSGLTPLLPTILDVNASVTQNTPTVPAILPSVFDPVLESPPQMTQPITNHPQKYEGNSIDVANVIHSNQSKLNGKYKIQISLFEYFIIHGFVMQH